MSQLHVMSVEKFDLTIAESRLVNVGDQIGNADKGDDIEVNLSDQPLLGMRVYFVRESMYIGEDFERNILIGGARSNGLLKLLRLCALLRRITLGVRLDILSIGELADVLSIIRHDGSDRDEIGLKPFYLIGEMGCPLNNIPPHVLTASMTTSFFAAPEVGWKGGEAPIPGGAFSTIAFSDP